MSWGSVILSNQMSRDLIVYDKNRNTVQLTRFWLTLWFSLSKRVRFGLVLLRLLTVQMFPSVDFLIVINSSLFSVNTIIPLKQSNVKHHCCRLRATQPRLVRWLLIRLDFQRDLCPFPRRVNRRRHWLDLHTHNELIRLLRNGPRYSILL